METAETQEKRLFVKDLRGSENIRSTFLVQSKSLPLNKNGKPYLSLILADSTGTVDARLWNDVERLAPTFNEGDVVAVSGKTHVFQNRLQLVLSHLVPLPSEETCLDNYLARTNADLEALYQDLIQTFEGLSNPWIKRLGLDLLNDPEIASRYKVCPAAKTIHHAFLGGLLVHSQGLVKLVDAVLPFYARLDRSLLVFGAAFHDFGKIFELNYQGRVGYTDEGRLVGHIAIGVTLIDRKIRLIEGFPEALEWQLKHLILSHHGHLEYGSPKRPCTLEAQMLHHLDDMDSKIQSIQALMESENTPAGWTALHKAYDQYYYKPEV